MAGLGQALLVLMPVPLDDGVLHEQEHPSNARYEPSHVLHDRLRTLGNTVDYLLLGWIVICYK